ncbi:glycosyltransferase involved in cell wall biosynthesis [Thalassobacillus devorans]|nr:glycosyltransferase family 4 protein [Thalassobacillus devorans]NIK28605.1 glycosyltransferase involved in cell wall biosynthesis [Thalassobacillus devorans]
MKIVILDPSFFTFPYDKCLCEGLSSEGHEVFLIGTSSERIGKYHAGNFKLIKHYYKFSSLIKKNKFGLLIKGINHIFNNLTLLFKLKKIKPDIIHFQWLPLPIFDMILIQILRRKTKVFFTMHDTTLYNGEGTSRIQQIGYARLLKLFDGIIVHTKNSKNKLINLQGISTRKIAVIPHGILDYYNTSQDTKEIKENNKIEWSGDTFNLLVFGSIKGYKGIDILIKALPLIEEKLRERIKVTIAGTGKEEEINRLKLLANKLKVSNFIIWDLRFIPEEEVASHFKSASLVVMPYRTIDQSGVLMTAIGFNVPVIATKIGGIPETIENNVHGQLIPANNPEALALSLSKVLINNQLLDLYKRNLRTLAEHKLNWDNIGAITTNFYLKVKNEVQP